MPVRPASGSSLPLLSIALCHEQMSVIVTGWRTPASAPRVNNPLRVLASRTPRQHSPASSGSQCSSCRRVRKGNVAIEASERRPNEKLSSHSHTIAAFDHQREHRALLRSPFSYTRSLIPGAAFIEGCAEVAGVDVHAHSTAVCASICAAPGISAVRQSAQQTRQPCSHRFCLMLDTIGGRTSHRWSSVVSCVVVVIVDDSRSPFCHVLSNPNP